MNHRIYEDWLFASQDDPEALTPGQLDDLHEHMQDCESCRSLAIAWDQVENELRNEPMLAPEPGFGLRWQARLQADRLHRHQRQTAALLIFSSLGVAALLGVMLVLAWPWMHTPGVFLWVGLYRLLTLFIYANAAEEFLATLFQTATGVIPFVAWVFLAGVLSELTVLWGVSYRLLTNPRRITR
jgi:predicted anti-sigma-YlaC factor YlaD